MKSPFQIEQELMHAFCLWRDACDTDQEKVADGPEYDAMVASERENCRKVVTIKATTPGAAMAKFACLIELATDTFQNDEDHPANAAIATLREAGEFLPAAHGRAVQVALQGLLHLVEGYHGKRDRDERRLAAIKHGASVLSNLEHPLVEAEAVADTLHLLAQSIRDKEVANPIAYLANQLALHLGEVRTAFDTALEQFRDAEAPQC